MSTNLAAVLQQLLQNTSNLKVLQQLMTPDATYVSLNFDNPELKKIEPWTGTHKGPKALSEVFAAIQRFWKTLDFKVTDTIEQGSRRPLRLLYLQIERDREGNHISLWPVGALRGGKGGLPPVSRGQLWHCGLVQNRGRHTVPQRSLGKRG